MATNSSQYSSAQIRTQIRKALSGSKSAQIQIEGPLSESEVEQLRKETARIARDEMRAFARKRLRKLLT